MCDVPPLIDNRYMMQEALGKGAFATVYKCIDLHTKKTFAAKVILKQNLSKRDLIKLDSETRVCKKLDHPNIVRLHFVISMEKFHIFFFDVVTGGELFDDLVTREGNYTEKLAAKCMFQVLEAINYCHSMGVIHRDLKPENVLLESKEKKIIKVADFGLAVEVDGDDMKWFGLAGTPNYMAPEVFEMKPYGKPVDCWACGVLLYILLSGRQPFYHPDPRKLEAIIKSGEYSLEHPSFSSITVEGKDILQKLLCLVPTQRLTAAQALQHTWFVTIRTAAQDFPHRAETFEAFKQFNARRKMRAAFNTAIFLSKVNFLLAAKRRENRDTTTKTTDTTRADTNSGKKATRNQNRSSKK